MAGHLVTLAAFFVEVGPRPAAMRINILTALECRAALGAKERRGKEGASSLKYDTLRQKIREVFMNLRNRLRLRGLSRDFIFPTISRT